MNGLQYAETCQECGTTGGHTLKCYEMLKKRREIAKKVEAYYNG